MLNLTAIRTCLDGHVLFATLDCPPLNLIGPELGGDLVTLIQHLQAHKNEIRVVVFESGVPDFFSAHFDMRQTAKFDAELTRLAEGATIASLYDRISTLDQVTIAMIAGRIGGAGSEFALACDMRFASLERARFTQMEAGAGLIPGGGAAQRLPAAMGRARALEVMLSADTYPADIAERYGWINRALPDVELRQFVERLAQRIAGFPSSGIADIKRRVDELTRTPFEAVEEDLRLFELAVKLPGTQARLNMLYDRGMQTDGTVERDFGEALSRLGADA